MVLTVSDRAKVEIMNYFSGNHYLELLRLNSESFDILDRDSN